MKVLIKYLIFYPDNYQGAMGKHFKHEAVLIMDPSTTLDELNNTINDHLNEITLKRTNNWPDASFSIQEIKLFS